MTIGTRTSKKVHEKVLLLLLVVCSVFLVPLDADASEPKEKLIQIQSAELNLAAENMRQEIKTHFRGTRYYGKLLGVNAQIKSRSSAVVRRIDRNSEYRRLERDIQKLNELAWELSEVYESAISKSLDGVGRPVVGNTGHVVDQLAAMIESTERLKFSFLSLSTSATIMPVLGEGQQFSEFDANIEVAPGVPPVSLDQTPTPGSQPLKLEAPKPVLRSVLER